MRSGLLDGTQWLNALLYLQLGTLWAKFPPAGVRICCWDSLGLLLPDGVVTPLERSSSSSTFSSLYLISFDTKVETKTKFRATTERAQEAERSIPQPTT